MCNQNCRRFGVHLLPGAARGRREPRAAAPGDPSRGQLSLHADRGSSMTSKPVALLLADLGVTQSHSRPT
jgi:transposase InsO family protein